MVILQDFVIAYSAEESKPVLEDLLVPGPADDWQLRLPPGLRTYQGELEALLANVFAGKAHCGANLQLAQQMTINWCLSKYRKLGLSD